MRGAFRPLFLALAAYLCATPLTALAQEVTDEFDQPSALRMRSLRIGGAKLRVSLANDPDTVWIGHIAEPSWVPKDRFGNFLPNSPRDANGAPMVPGTVPVGGYGPYHVGRGANVPGGDVSSGVPGGAGTHFNGLWDFDHFQAGDDSLQGWWPIARPYQAITACNTDDKARACYGLNYGNNGNYIINQGPEFKRTFGVTGYWHVDNGNLAPRAYVDVTPTIPGPNVEWTPLGGTQSAWCGLRANDDFNAIDPISLGGTGNPINQRLLEYNGNNSNNQTGAINTAGATDKNFPGYGSQWDQILYRDIDASSIGIGDNLTISFRYVHALSPERGGYSCTRVGYFWKDPVRPTFGVSQDGNFVSAAEAEFALQGPVDSFTVTLGIPVDIQTDVIPGVGNDYTASDGNTYNIYDPQRRWWSEVIATGGTGNAPMIELLSRSRFSTAAGGVSDPPFTAPPATATFSQTITRGQGALGQSLDALIGAAGGRVRLAFRVLTNRSNDDEDTFVSGFSSYTRGAAIIDDVVVQKNGAGAELITNGDFEAVSSIDNTVNGILCTVSNGSQTVSSAGGFQAVTVGQTVTGQNISAGTLVIAKSSNSTITISNPATALSGSQVRTLYFDLSTALAAWKSTGKPPGVYVHVHCVNTTCTQYTPALWNDPCSPPTLSDPRATSRTCNMVGNVLTGGDHDVNEKPGGLFHANDQDRERLGASPVMILKTDPDPTQYNPMGLNADILAKATEWALWYDIHTAGFHSSGGNGGHYLVGLQSYPAQQPNGALCWAETRFPGFYSFNTGNTCGPRFTSLKQSGRINTSNPSGIPDSIRVYFEYQSRCWTSSLTATTCSPTTGSQVGGYIDNVSLAIYTAPVAGLSNLPTMWFADAFPTFIDPATGQARTSFAAAAFDTATAKVKSAVNMSTFNTAYSVPGDSAVVTTGAIPGGGRVDLVFRILPGPGNYVTVGDRLSAIRQVPTSTTPAVGNASSSNFWESYMGNTGAYGTGGNGVSGSAMDPDGLGPIGAGTRWDWNAWCSARMDTLERNMWPALIGNLADQSRNSGGTEWMTTYHELDPRYTFLGIAKNRCFFANPNQFSNSSCNSRTPATTADCNIVCELLPGPSPFGVFPPTWSAGAGGTNAGTPDAVLPFGQTYEFTKIVPDGQLTPGSHVQYFFRRSPGAAQPVDLWPDTTRIFDGGTLDGGRWFSFSVLPDRWKDAAYGGEGLLCMLVVDNYDRNGDEFYWVSAADTLGLTSWSKRGAHNGWYAAGGTNDGLSFSQATFRPDNGGQPGSMWDLWNSKGSESTEGVTAWLSNRWTATPPPGSFLDGKKNTTGPTGDMLRYFYRSLVYLTGTAAGFNFGSTSQRPYDDFAQLNDFALSAGAGPRSVTVIGSGFASGLTGQDGNTPPAGGPSFLNSFFGVGQTNLSYRSYSGNPYAVAHYEESPGSAHDLAGGQSGLTYGVSDGCGINNAVLQALPGSAAGAVAETFYENYGTAGPYPASVYVPSGGPGSPHPQATLLIGTRISRLGSYAPALPLGRANFRAHLFKDVSITAAMVGCAQPVPNIGVGDIPLSGSNFANYLGLRSSNPVRSGEARLSFGLAKTEKVEVRIFDVTGRSVKTVTRRVFQAGQEHVVIWDGTDDAGKRVKNGVFFYRLETPTWSSRKKLVLLAN